MVSVSSKDNSTVSNYPRALSSIIISVGLLAVFVSLASWILLSNPIGDVVRNYFNDVAHTRGLDSSVSLSEERVSEGHGIDKVDGVGSGLEKSEGSTKVGESRDFSLSGNVTFAQKPDNEHFAPTGNEETIVKGLNDVPQKLDDTREDCDLFHGEWFYDSAGPVYTNNTCPLITQMQNCQGNGRPDKEYESWRWKPSQCELPRFNGTKFLELMSGKTLAFVGDSVARNQMESLLCLLWQVETPKNRGNRHMHRWYFRSKSVMIVRIWSSWLVHQTSEPFSYVPEGIAKLHLDVPDESFMQYIPNFDVVVLSSGHWFAKQSIYMLNNEIVGTQLWSPPNKQPMKINNIEAFGISVETSMAAMATHPNYTGLTILRSYSPDHYEGGAWNTGGSCTGKAKPVLPDQLVENEYTNTMHQKQVMGFHQAVKKQTNKSKLKLMDITDVFSYRHDGHPGPYRSPDPNKITKRGPDGKPPPQDCLHWCMPGAVDTWNELVLEIIRREFEGNQNSAS
ncbi:protein YLS7-like [Silene latifolia]|uniref:protein YLS7-like n=1 Tax=Silene latifolia TaxID=37657 RepID=UPI003D77076F